MKTIKYIITISDTTQPISLSAVVDIVVNSNINNQRNIIAHTLSVTHNIPKFKISTFYELKIHKS